MPKPDVRMDLLEPTDNRTGCAYKGFARYWSLNVGEIKRENIAWSYAIPIADCAKIALITQACCGQAQGSSSCAARSANKH
jgi:uncharacterized protein (DUF427 family)